MRSHGINTGIFQKLPQTPYEVLFTKLDGFSVQSGKSHTSPKIQMGDEQA